ncbi:MAG: type IV pilin N-terminal domain-containing protein [Candidatus Diapherotrites archaeon]|nr:type IV pilin N-terminal domain-containing protein [Candidatus Diapherotrites archaeon]
MKGVSPIVGVVLLVAIAVLGATSLYFWAGGVTTREVTVDEPNAISATVISPAEGKILVANLGDSNLVIDYLNLSHATNLTCNFNGTVTLPPGGQALCIMPPRIGTSYLYAPRTGTALVVMGGSELTTITYQFSLIGSSGTYHEDFNGTFEGTEESSIKLVDGVPDGTFTQVGTDLGSAKYFMAVGADITLDGPLDTVNIILRVSNDGVGGPWEERDLGTEFPTSVGMPEGAFRYVSYRLELFNGEGGFDFPEVDDVRIYYQSDADSQMYLTWTVNNEGGLGWAAITETCGEVEDVLVNRTGLGGITSLTGKINYTYGCTYETSGEDPSGNPIGTDLTVTTGFPILPPAVCGDHVCEQDETSANCPGDCCDGDVHANTGLCDANCGETAAACDGIPVDGTVCSGSDVLTCCSGAVLQTCTTECVDTEFQPGIAYDGTCSEGACGTTDVSGTEIPEQTCQDLLDNDCDGLVDCADPDCEPDPACVAPENDECASKTVVTDGGHAFTTTGATTDGTPTASCPGQVYNDVWFAYTATCTGTLTASTCNQADFDTVIVIYEGADCLLLEERACNDNEDTCGVTSIALWDVTSGVDYTIRLGSLVDGTTGTGTLSLSCASCGDYNDNCEGCISFGCTWYNYTNGSSYCVDAAEMECPFLCYDAEAPVGVDECYMTNCTTDFCTVDECGDGYCTGLEDGSSCPSDCCPMADNCTNCVQWGSCAWYNNTFDGEYYCAYAAEGCGPLCASEDTNECYTGNCTTNQCGGEGTVLGFLTCVSGNEPAGPACISTKAPACDAFDVNTMGGGPGADGMVSLSDFNGGGSFQTCYESFEPGVCEIFDIDSNLQDGNPDGIVDEYDFFAGWAITDPGQWDFDDGTGSGNPDLVVDVADFVYCLQAWGDADEDGIGDGVDQCVGFPDCNDANLDAIPDDCAGP